MPCQWRQAVDESYDLEFRDPAATRFFLLAIAQEEFAKGFILFLVREGIAPLNSALRRAMKDHTCKQIVGVILDYMIMYWNDIGELEVMIERDFKLGGRLPHDIASALEVFCYEKIGRWTKNNWVWAEDPHYDREVLAIAKGKRDRRKQNALYVGVGSRGQVCSTPAEVSEEEVKRELDRAKRYEGCVESLRIDGKLGFDKARFDKIIEAFVLLFETERRRADQVELLGIAGEANRS